MNKTQAFKFAARAIVGAGTTTISNSIIRNNVAPANLPQQISVGVAAVVIGSMASEATKKHTNDQIDAFVDLWKSAKGEKIDEEETPADTVITDES